MRLLKKQISAKDGSGLLLIQPDTAEDLWHAYNLIQVGDHVRAQTVRKVINETSTGSTSSTRKRFLLTIGVQKIDFDPLLQQRQIQWKNSQSYSLLLQYK